jgi:hypothetical protein
LNRIMILLALLALVVVGCAEQAASPSASESATSEATPSEEPSEEPTEEESEAPQESLGEGAGDLDDVLPDEVGGVTIEYQHTSGEDVLGGEGSTPEAVEFFERVGAETSDISSAFGIGFDAESGAAVTIIAFRVEGADEGQLRTEFLATLAEEESTVTEEQTIGGKSVVAFGEAEASQGYVYVNDDVVFVVGGEPLTLAEEALGLLP